MRAANKFIIISTLQEDNKTGFIIDSTEKKGVVVYGNDDFKIGSTVYYSKSSFVGKFDENLYIYAEDVIAVDDVETSEETSENND